MAAGCDIVRVAVPTQDDADALAVIARKSPLPVIATSTSSRSTCSRPSTPGARGRREPGNIRQFDDQVKEIARAATDAGTSIRMRVNAAALERPAAARQKYGNPGGPRRVRIWEASLLEEHGFHDFEISVDRDDPVIMVRAYEASPSAATGPCTSSKKPAFRAPSSATAFGALLSKGIGDPRVPVRASGRE